LVKPGPFGVSLGHEYIQDIPTSSEIHFHAGSAPMTQIDRSPWRVKAEHPFQLKNLATLPAASEASKEAENDAWPALFQKAADKLEKLQMAIFNRSHYEDVLVPRVRGWMDKSDWLKRYQHVANFEALLHDQGITVLKCYLHISKQEQKSRLQARLDDPLKQWKFQASDFSDRQLWHDYLEAYQDAMAATSSANAPWYVVPSDSKRYRDLFLAELLAHTLEKMDLAFPPKSFDLSTIQLD
jgi:polyphosphate kinase 2 (PPK2 family)